MSASERRLDVSVSAVKASASVSCSNFSLSPAATLQVADIFCMLSQIFLTDILVVDMAIMTIDVRLLMRTRQ